MPPFYFCKLKWKRYKYTVYRFTVFHITINRVFIFVYVVFLPGRRFWNMRCLDYLSIRVQGKLQN